jgi:hypothetical protein
VASALDLQARLADPATLAAFRSAMPEDAKALAIEVSIHHSEHFAYKRQFEVFVSADVGEYLFAPTLDGSTVYFKYGPPPPSAVAAQAR